MLKLNTILSVIAPAITFQMSTKVDDEWENERVSFNDVKASELPDEGSDKPPVIYNMWVNSHATEENVASVRDKLAEKGLHILTKEESVYSSKSNGSYRFMILGDQVPF